MASLKDEADSLKKDIGKLTDDFRKPSDPSPQDFEILLRRIQERIDQARQNVGAPTPAATPISPDEPQPTNMQAFFDSVATSLLSTQRKLDLESQSYIASTASKPELQPAIFRIPRIQADLKFAIENVNEKGVNVIFFKQKQEERTLNEQSISFEIVAAPAPPEASGPGSGLPQFGIVYSIGLRDQLEEIVKADPRPTVTPLAKQWDQALVVEVGSATGFIVILSKGDDQEKDLGVWHIDTASRLVTVALSINRDPADSEVTGPVREILAEFGKRQAAFLAAIRGATK